MKKIFSLLIAVMIGISLSFQMLSPMSFAQDDSSERPGPGEKQPTTEEVKLPPIFKGDLGKDPSRYTIKGLTEVILPGVAKWVAAFLGALAVIFLIVAGIQFLMAGGEPEKITKAAKTAFYVIAGVLLVMFAYALVFLFLTIFSP